MENKIKQQESRAWGISSMVTSIVSLLLMFMPYFGLPLSIFSVVAHNKQKKIMETGISMSGFVMGIIGIVINSIMLLFFFIGLLILASTGTM